MSSDGTHVWVTNGGDDTVSEIQISAASTASLLQGSPTSSTVADGAGYTGHLTVTSPNGTVSYTETASADSSDVVVNSAGAISAATTLPAGTYTVRGTDSDTAGDTGTWGFTLTVTRPATQTVCIPDFPAGYVITGYTTQAGCGPGQSDWYGFNAANVALPRNGLYMCEAGNGQVVPAGYVVTDVISAAWPGGYVPGGAYCGQPSGAGGYEAVQINQPTDGTIMCVPNGIFPVPDGYVITRVFAEGGYLASGTCGIVLGNINYNAFQITHPSDGLMICEPFVLISVPPGYVQTAQLNTRQCGPIYSWAFNAVQIAVVPQTSTPGVTTRSMIASGSGALDAWVTCPASVSSCTDTLNLRAPSPGMARDSRDSADKRATVQTTLATGSVKLLGGHQAAIALKLTANARRLLARKHTIRAQAILMVHESRTTASTARPVATYTSSETVTIHETVSPSDAILKARLLSEITPTGKAATITAILKHHGYPLSFSALTGGRVVIAWYQIPKSYVTRGARPTLVATAIAALTHAGTGTTKVTLTAAGRRLLKTSKRLKLTAEGTFTPTSRYAVVASKSFSLKR